MTVGELEGERRTLRLAEAPERVHWRPMAQVKGTAFLSLRAFLDEVGGAPLRAKLTARLPRERAELLESALAVGWHPLDAYVAAIDALGDALAKPPEDAARAYGRFAAGFDLSTIHRLFLRFANPAYVLEKAGEYWGRYYDTGTWRVERVSPTRAQADLAGFGAVDPVFCEFLTEYVRRMFELVGARDVRVSHPRCRARQAEACHFVAEWR